MIDIKNPAQLRGLLNTLHPETQALFGQFSAQGMIEHLTDAVRLSIEAFPVTLAVPERQAEIVKRALIYTDKAIPQGFKNPLLTTVPPALKEARFDTAVDVLLTSLEAFHHFFATRANYATMHPTLGKLTYSEWVILHTKHFTHHFNQFGLVS